MTKTIKVPGFGTVEIDLQPSEYAQSGKLFVQRMQERFFVVRHRPAEDPSDLILIKAVREVMSIQRAEGKAHHELDMKRKVMRSAEPENNGRLVH